MKYVFVKHPTVGDMFLGLLVEEDGEQFCNRSILDPSSKGGKQGLGQFKLNCLKDYFILELTEEEVKTHLGDLYQGFKTNLDRVLKEKAEREAPLLFRLKEEELKQKENEKVGLAERNRQDKESADLQKYIKNGDFLFTRVFGQLKPQEAFLDFSHPLRQFVKQNASEGLLEGVWTNVGGVWSLKKEESGKVEVFEGKTKVFLC